MPSFSYPVAPKEPIKKTVTVTDKEYQHSIVDTKVQPLNSLITHVEGASRIVDYYSQIVSGNEEPQKYSPDLAPHLQQYREIYDFEIKQTDFSFDFDDKSQEATATGTATIYPPLIPNYGDVFIADIGNGMVGLFALTRIQKKSIFKQACYEVDFSIIRILDNENEVTVLKQKVVESYYFVKDFILYGQNPLLVESEFLLLKDSRRILHEAVEDYFSEFFSRELSCLTAPGYGVPTYDPFAVKAFMECVEVESHPRLRQIHVRSTDELKEFWDSSVWTSLINPSQNQYRSIWSRARPVSVNSFNIHPRMNSIRFSGYSQCIRPLDKLENVDTYYRLNENGDQGFYGWFINRVKPIAANGQTISDRSSRNGACWCKVQNWYHSHHLTMAPWDPQNHLSHIEQYNHTCHDSDCPCACHYVKDENNEVNDTNSYIFSPDFWDEKIPSVDGFEQVVKQHLSLKKVDAAILLQLLLQRKQWTPQERYYKMLVLIIILIASVRSM